MTFRLVSVDSTLAFELRPGMPLVLGRSLSSDIPVLDPTISRRHAELTVENGSVVVRDLGSSNGTFIGSTRVTHGRLTPGERIVFGKVPFELRAASPLLIDDASAEGVRRAARAGTTIIRQVPVPDADEALERALRASGVQRAIDETSPVVSAQERDRVKLTLLLEVSKALTRTANDDALLQKMVDFTFRLIDVDRVSILLLDDEQRAIPRLERARSGRVINHDVSTTLVQTVIDQKVAVLSDNVADSHRPTPPGDTITARTAACAPLVAADGRVLGVLYVDSLRASSRVSDVDLDFLVTFAGIGAVALDNIRYGERIRQEGLIRSNFERFFTPHLAERIAGTQKALTPGGERRMVAVLFSDIRGFTPLAAQMAPDETAYVLTEFFTEMVDCVFKHGGTLDKFMGDCVMAQWGAPLTGQDDPDRALDAALDMLRAVERLNATWHAQGRPEIELGIGINFGEAFAGYMGSERRLEYTVIGDTVNTASRLCAWAEGGEILVSESLRAALTRPREFGERPPLSLRGKPNPVPVYRALR